jgi:NADH-quinone oxidoreductase subunit H
VIPYGGIYEFGDTTLSLVAADIDWGVLYVLALGALSSYGAVIAGWTSKSSWSRLGSIRSSLQTISYSVAMGLSLVGVFMVFGSLKLSDMALAQDASFRIFGFLELLGWLPVLPGWLAWLKLPYWGIFLQPLGFLMFLTCALAANKRPPFDLPEAGSELAGGTLTEYSGMRFGLFYVSEFVQVVVIAGLCATMFLGGWSVPYLTQATVIEGIGSFLGEGLATVLCLLLHLASFFTKVAAMIWLQILIRWSLPRVRYDQLMDLCWKWLLPFSLLNVFATAAALLLTRSLLEAA